MANLSCLCPSPTWSINIFKKLISYLVRPLVDVSDSETRKCRVHVSECVTRTVGRLDAVSLRISEINSYSIYRTYRLTGATVVQQLNLVLIFERYEMSTYVCEFDFWVLMIGLLD